MALEPILQNAERVDEKSTPCQLASPAASILSFVSGWIAVLLTLFGGSAIHLWTAYLFYRNWGGFAGVVALFSPAFSELLALGLCFGWGTWYYSLAVATWLFAGCALFFVEQPERNSDLKTVLGYLWLLGLAGLTTALSVIAYQYHNSPAALSEAARADAEEYSIAVSALLTTAPTNDPKVLATVAETKPRLREQVSRLSPAEFKILKQNTDAALLFIHSIERDFLASLADPDPKTGEVAIMTARTRQAYSLLPPRLADGLGSIAVYEQQLTSLAKALPAQLTSERKDLCRSACDAAHARRAQLYADILGQTMATQGQMDEWLKALPQ